MRPEKILSLAVRHKTVLMFLNFERNKTKFFKKYYDPVITSVSWKSMNLN